METMIQIQTGARIAIGVVAFVGGCALLWAGARWCWDGFIYDKNHQEPL